MTRIMAIYNATPDSFYAPSRYNESVFESNADIIDIGACSTRPGSEAVTEDVEWERLRPVLERLQRKGFFSSGKELSIDTFRPGIVRRVFSLLEGEKFIVNDVGGARTIDEMSSLCRVLGLQYVATHNGPADDTLHWFKSIAPGLEGLDWILDPGLGFGKDTKNENWHLLHQLKEFKRFGRPVLVGASRKRFTEGSLELTLEAHRIALENGADILRVHDISQEIPEQYREALL